MLYRLFVTIASAQTAPKVTLVSPGAATEQAVTIGDYLKNAIFSPLVRIIIALAVFSIAYAGLLYIFSNVPGVKGVSKERIWSAVLGLLLAMAAWLILREINPSILTTLLNNI